MGTFVGTSGNDVLSGTTGPDTLTGLAGDDRYLVDNGGDVVQENAGEGNDRILASVSYVLAAGQSVETVSTTDTLSTFIVNLTGNELANTILGNAADNVLQGKDGNDALAGNAGNDTLIGGIGADVMNGGAGNDFFYVDNASDQVAEKAGEGNDRVFATVSFTLAAGQEVETLSTDDALGSSVINLSGNALVNTIMGNAAANILNGADGDDTLVGNAGNDILNGGTGVDSMNGGAGNDNFYIDNASDKAFEKAGDGADRVFASVSYALIPGQEIEILSTTDTLSSFAANLTGNELANTILGNAAGNLLQGKDGNDAIAGNAGNDTIYGGTGADAMNGGTGNDWFYVDNTGDQAFEKAGEGDDRVLSSVSYALAAGQEIETLSTDNSAGTAAINLTGNELVNFVMGNAGANILGGGGGNDTIVGNAGNDQLNGGTGADVMNGGLGDDFFYVDNAGDQAFEKAGEGNDRVFASASFTLAAGQEIETLSTDNAAGTAAINLTGNELVNFVMGNAGANILGGGGGNDTIVGNAGNDQLNGGTGADVMNGGLGDDFFYIDNAGDQAFEKAGEGNDRVFASASFTLAAGQEIETLSTDNSAGTAAINLTGNELVNFVMGNAGANILGGGGGNDTIVGNAGNDQLNGGTGADVMNGGLGDDFFYVDNGADQAFEKAGEGNDRVFASLSYTLAAGQEIETLSTDNDAGTAAINLTGNALANILIGNNGANLLDGKGGNDVLTGNGGADNFAFTTALGAGNVDQVNGFVHGTDKIQLGGNAGEPFAALASGALAAGSFVIGAAAAQADDYILYDSATGALLYDADGNGAGAAVPFATLSTGLSLTAADFIVSGPANHTPTVTSGASASVAENSPASTIVYQATATDADGDRIIWTLSGTDAGYLTIDPATGAVRLIESADFETKTSYSFSVTAGDSDSVAVAKQVTLNVTDVADGASTPIINEIAAPNDSTGAAQAIDRNQFMIATNADLPDQTLPSATIHGGISTNSDIDVYAITLQAGEKIVLDVDHTTNSLDSFLRFYGTDGLEIVNNDDKISADPGSNPPFDHNTDSYLTYRVATAGTYYFSVESFGDLDTDGEEDGPTVGESNGNYSLNVSIAPPASAAQIMDEDVDALISGAQWDHIALTYGFPTDVSQYPSGIDETTPATDFSPFTPAQQTATAQLLQLIANVSSLTFQPLAADPGNADIRYAMSDEADVAYAYYPTNGGPSSTGGTAWFNKADFNFPVRGNYAWMGILHETGHALGLKHGHEAPAVSFDHDSVEYTVMTYRSHPGSDLNGYTNEEWGYPQTLMMLDIAALQRMYGANFNFNSGNSVYGWSPTTGEMSINGVGQGAPGGDRVFMTIWDGGGDDTYDLSNYSTGVVLDLRPGEWSVTSSIQRADLGDGRFARGEIANALMYQGNTASLIENAIGGSAFDTLTANQAANHLTGGGGGDHFLWMSVADGAVTAVDHVTDFQSLADTVDLSLLDTNPATASRDAFHSIGTGAFSGVAGELRQEVISGSMNLFGDADGDGVADFHIILDNVTSLAGPDIIF